MTVELKSTAFRREREASWRRLEELLKRVEKVGPRRLTADELTALPRLYQAALSSLSVARAIALDRNLTNYLEALVNRAYFQVYSNKTGILATIYHFVVRDFPRTFRKYSIHVALATILMGLGGVVGFVMTTSDPDNYYNFVSPGMAGERGPDSSREELHDILYNKTEREADAGNLSGFTSFLFLNNFRVALMCLVAGIVPGVLVFYLMFFNGLVLGAFAAIHHRLDLSVDLWGWLLPHGVTELFAVVLCGGAGLAIGQSLVFPGRYTRLNNLARTGREVALFAAAAGIMLVYAALVEGYFRQLVNSVPVRYAVAGASLLFWILYLSLAGRQKTAEASHG